MLIIGDVDSVLFWVGYFLVDMVGGLMVVMVICGVLNVEKCGVFIDVFMLELVLVIMGWVVFNYLVGGVIFILNGNENLILVLFGVF